MIHKRRRRCYQLIQIKNLTCSTAEVDLNLTDKRRDTRIKMIVD